jgi:hypothetical protein
MHFNYKDQHFDECLSLHYINIIVKKQTLFAQFSLHSKTNIGTNANFGPRK